MWFSLTDILKYNPSFFLVFGICFFNAGVCKVTQEVSLEHNIFLLPLTEPVGKLHHDWLALQLLILTTLVSILLEQL